MTVPDALSMIVVAAGASVVAAGVGALVLRRTRGRSVRTQALVITMCSLFTAVAGIVVAAKAMFISSHDLNALLVVLVAATAVAAGAAVQLGADIDGGARHVRALAQSLVDDPEHATPSTMAATAPVELSALATELETVSARLTESRRRERALEASRRELIAWMSHDLRSPLAAIRAMAEALDEGVADDPDTTTRYHRQIKADAERLSGLVDDLFELSRIQSGTGPADTTRIALHDLVADAVTGARTRAAVKGVTVIDRVDGLPAIDVPRRELTRVLHNLLDNAIRHTPSGGQIVVESHSDENGAVLHVVDECGGIPLNDLDRVFDVAFRGDAARARDGAGGGLGLTIAKGLVEAHDGMIAVDNHARGCRFTVRLPIPA